MGDSSKFPKSIPNPLGCWVEAEDIGQAVWLFASRAASYITGQVLYVDGGLILGL